ncbi:MAG: hypothetical protein A2138_27240 [Deltaproteobacteria bacterium RBG_16_71_12]|nr:MAG: hypothetical protein A2138_27240 [Deltaproteobacteria bacterium RBG_16_71_12]
MTPKRSHEMCRSTTIAAGSSTAVCGSHHSSSPNPAKAPPIALSASSGTSSHTAAAAALDGLTRPCDHSRASSATAATVAASANRSVRDGSHSASRVRRSITLPPSDNR